APQQRRVPPAIAAGEEVRGRRSRPTPPCPASRTPGSGVCCSCSAGDVPAVRETVAQPDHGQARTRPEPAVTLGDEAGGMGRGPTDPRTRRTAVGRGPGSSPPPSEGARRHPRRDAGPVGRPRSSASRYPRPPPGGGGTFLSPLPRSAGCVRRGLGTGRLAF
ncbi:hypothetical protein THAOC_36295, partial [Thalassiosira oceanica]